jgi:5-methylcytosine-specific restriction endonuclease McrA
MRGQATHYIGLYGNVQIPKAWCNDCGRTAFVIDGMLMCCDVPVDSTPERYKRECEPQQHRKLPPLRERQRQLEQQDYRCFYCERAFKSSVFKKGRIVKLRIHWDHMVPYALTQNNRKENFVAACHICNSIKGDLCFQTVDEARIHILHRWREKAIYDLS